MNAALIVFVVAGTLAALWSLTLTVRMANHRRVILRRLEEIADEAKRAETNVSDAGVLLPAERPSGSHFQVGEPPKLTLPRRVA
jgi:hypothetical protein